MAAVSSPMLQIGEHHYRPGLRQERHSHAEASITMLLAGSIMERVGYSEEIARPLSIVVKPADTEHADIFGPDGAHTLQIVLPSDYAEEIGRSGPLNRSWQWIHAGPPVGPFMMLLRELRLTHSSAPMRIHDAALGVISSITDQPRQLSSTPPRWISDVRSRIDDTNSMQSVAILAKDAGVHPVYLARQFRRWYGCSITDYVRRRKVQHAARHIAGSPRALSSASYEAGFADQAHMCRVFKSETGITPGSFRALVSPKVSTVQFQRITRH